MIFPVMKPRIRVTLALAFALALMCVALPAHGQKKPPQLEKPMAGPRAAALRITWLYIAPDPASQKVDRAEVL